jgi:hypothetical protein
LKTTKAGRNDACLCGSGKKFKKCCGPKQQRSRGAMTMFAIVGLLIAAGIAAAIASFTGERHVARPTGVWSAEHGHFH